MIFFFKQHFKRLVELADNARAAYNEMVYEYENEERKCLMLKMNQISLSTNYNNIQPTIPSHFGHSRTASSGSNISIDPSLINYRTHSRTPSGGFNFLSLNNNANTGGHNGGHSRSASGGGGGTLNIDLNTGALLSFHKHLTHSRNASNCSNISFVSRLSEPISEVGVSMGSNTNITINSTTGIFNLTQVTLPNSNATIAAVQYYSEQVRNEMRECEVSVNNENESEDDNGEIIIKKINEKNLDDNDDDENQNCTENNTLSNLHLSCIHEIDAGNEADIDEDDFDAVKKTFLQQQQQRRKNSKSTGSNEDKVIITDNFNLISNINDNTLNDESDSSVRNNESFSEN